MSDVSAAAPGIVRQAIQVIKVRTSAGCLRAAAACAGLTVRLSLQSIDALQQQATGLCEILNLKPSAASLQIHREVLGSTAMPPAGGAARGRQPVHRAVEEAAAAQAYEADSRGAERSEEEEE